MHRRRFLHLSSLGALSASVPAFLTCARTGHGMTFSGGLDGELEKARAGGKPLLVLVVPREADRKRERGRVFGAYLNHASPAAMADLALAHVVCATMREVRETLGDAAPAGAPLMVLAETDGGATARALDPDLPEVGPVDYSSGLSLDEQEDRIDAAFTARNEAIAEAVHAALAGDSERLRARAGQCAAVLTDDEVTRLKQADDVAALDPALVDRGAAWLADEALAADAERRAAIEAALAAAAVARLREVPPPGARWASTDGCGIHVEGEEEDEGALRIACGMAFTPRLGRRFLQFYAGR